MRNRRVVAGGWLSALWWLAASVQAAEPPVEADFEYRGALRLEFAEPMQVWGNEVRRDLVRLTPQLPLACRWDDDVTLACNVEGPDKARPATRYRIDLAAGLRTQQGATLPAQVLHAETERPELWAGIARWDGGLPEFRITANMAVTPADVRAVLSVRAGERSLPYRLEPDPGPGEWRFRLRLSGDAGEDARIALRVAPGLHSSAGALPGTQDRTLLRAHANESFRVRSVSCPQRAGMRTLTAPGERAELDCLADESVLVALSQAPDAASRARFEARLPEGIRVEAWLTDASAHYYYRASEAAAAPGTSVRLAMTRPNSLVLLSLDDLVSTTGARVAPLALTLRTGDVLPVLKAPGFRVLFAADGLPAARLHAVNAGGTDLRVTALGRAFAHGSVRIPPSDRNADIALRAPLDAKALREGGWTRWQVQPSAGEAPLYLRRQGQVEFAAPVFDLVAWTGQREVVVWANAWSDGAPVAEAQVELLHQASAASEPQVIAQARTDAQGAAMLTLPAGFSLPEELDGEYPQWWLRASHGRGPASGRAVLPLGASQRYGMKLGVAAPRLLWGVSDRPLYTAGSKVSYQVWLRERASGRLRRIARTEPLALGLVSIRDAKTIVQWQATPDADGVVHGELDLPVHLTDGTYCIGAPEAGEENGACFFVGTYRAQDLWVRADAQDRLLRDGDAFVFDVEAGYYSGGPAAGMPLTDVSTLLTGLPLGEAYPQYAGYTFIDVLDGTGRGGLALASPPKGLRTRDDGRLQVSLPVAFPAGEGDDRAPPAFGRLQAVVEARPSDREGTVSNAALARYARYARYVGLRSEPRWWDARGPVRLQPIVIDADGGTVDAARVEVEVRYLGREWSDRKDAPGERVAQCSLVSGQSGECDVPRTRSGLYRAIARSGDAAPAELTQYVWADDNVRATSREISLELPQRDIVRDRPVQVVLKQPQPQARALFVFRQHGALLGYQAVEVRAGAQAIDLHLPPAAQGKVGIGVYIRDTGDVAAAEPGYRALVPLRSAVVQVSVPPVRQPTLEVALRADTARPGQPARLVLTNTGDRARQVAVTVTDDAVRAMAGEWLAYADPLGPHWLGRDSGYDYPWTTGFHAWHRSAWSWRLPWSVADIGNEYAGGLVSNRSLMSPSPAAPLQVAEPRAVDIVTSPPPPPPPAAPADYFAESADRGSMLDRIEVTGSRIDPADIFQAGARPATDLRPREQGAPQAPLARVRTRFVDTAFWRAGIVLAPGESRSFDVDLPDNLTRWRAIAWSGDADDGFEQTEAALEIGLPVEARLQVPVRLYPGDRARLAANLRQSGDAALPASARIEVQGDGAATSGDGARGLVLPPRGQTSIAIDLAPAAVGSLRVIASVDSATGGDAVAAPVEVASPVIAARRTQAGWLQDAPVSLRLPELPTGAQQARLAVEIGRGGAGLVERWTRDLQAYPHRCWEQILSRAVGAALAIERGDTAHWPQADEAVKEALDNAAVFQGERGDMRYFADVGDGRLSFEPRAQVALTAYTVQAFGWLRARGHAVPPDVERRAQEFLARQQLPVEAREEDEDAPDGSDDEDMSDVFARAARAAADAAARAADETTGSDDAVFAIAVRARAGAPELDGLWRQWTRLSLPARIVGLDALAAARHPASAQALASVLARFPLQGRARRLDRDDGWSRWMGSRMREQCALIGVLEKHPGLAGTDVRNALLNGLVDLYSGGSASVDTQTGAYCLMALHDASLADARTPAVVQAALGTQQATLALAAGEDRARWQAPASALASAPGQALTLAQAPGEPAWLGYVAELDYQEDAAQARPSAVGLALARRYEVLRDGRWSAIGARPVREGDWIRVTLTVSNSAPRHFVALTDDVPGGLRPTDLSLSAVAGLDLQRVSSTGSAVFGTRRLDPRKPRFYAEYLPAGRHEVHYFARVANAGDYLAAPATAELMYGNVSHARTAADRMRVAPSP